MFGRLFSHCICSSSQLRATPFLNTSSRTSLQTSLRLCKSRFLTTENFPPSCLLWLLKTLSLPSKHLKTSTPCQKVRHTLSLSNLFLSIPQRNISPSTRHSSWPLTGELTEKLHHFLERNLPKPSKKSKVQLGVVESKLGTAIQDGLSIPCVSSQKVVELMRGIRAHFSRFIKTLPEADYNKAQLGLSHSYSRCKIKFNINRADNHIIQSISLLDQLDKDINTFAMRVR